MASELMRIDIETKQELDNLVDDLFKKRDSYAITVKKLLNFYKKTKKK